MKQMDIFRKILLTMVGMLIPIVVLFAYSNKENVSVIEREIKSSSLHKLSFFQSQMDAQIYQLNTNMLTLVSDVDILRYVIRFDEDPFEATVTRKSLEKRLLHLSLTSPWNNRTAIHAPMRKEAVSSDAYEIYNPKRLNLLNRKTWLFSGEPDSPSTWKFTKFMSEPKKAAGDINKVNMVIESQFSAMNIQDMLDTYKLGSSGNPFLWMPEPDRIIGNRTAKPANLEMITNQLGDISLGERGSATFKLQSGEEVLLTYVSMPQLNGYIVDYVPLQNILSPIFKNTYIFYITCIMLLITACIAAFLLYRHVQVPLRKLNTGVQSIKQGNYSARITGITTSEFDQLFVRFNQMAEQIQKLIENVYEEKIRVRDATLKQLQSQINPHFLYNCFAHIVHMSDLGYNEGITAMSHNLCDYYRYSTRVDKPNVLLEEELKLVESYLEIQQIRIPRLTYTMEIPDEMYGLGFPRLLLQPLVENAVIHGIEPYFSADTIRIRGAVTEQGWEIWVEDNGPGMTEQAVRQLTEQVETDDFLSADSYGLRNVHQRLHIGYGPQSGLRFQALPGGGFRAGIEIYNRKELEAN
ncbi:hypothetical protein SY83_22445 [Paenibacillus swuensis]|uniref:HAMP domain-containing protein n=1 Tax=Paenibacillus swuensis TaxID=1178515 RepID=A0A172TNC3_9BACL|nr:histidine kinase [Paenibacillus swuensis]ANE48589.1 hypothetical protein SY83_22445 [Paenibacillus swuensis]